MRAVRAGLGMALLSGACVHGAPPPQPRRQPAPSRSEVQALPTLITTQALATLIAHDSATIIDVRTDVGGFLKNHVPGAVYLNVESLRSSDGGVPNLLLPAASYATIFSRLGVRKDRPVVIYSSGESRNTDATYVAWILAGTGHRAVRVLDGGFAKWELESRRVTRAYPHFRPTAYEVDHWSPALARLDDVRAALDNPSALLVDARIREQYTGEAGAQMRRGHIPGAINHYWQEDLIKREFARVWKARGELRARYAAQGITPDKDIIVYCNGGLESSHVYFTLRNVLDYPRVRVYDGSWTEWAEREDLPMVTGAGPFASARGGRTH